MKSMLLISLAFFVSLAAHAQPGDFYINRDDLFQFRQNRKALQDISTTDDCKARIKGLMCLVDETLEAHQTRNCQPGSENYAHSLETVYDLLPAKMQRVFCSLKVIFVEKNLESLAYAGLGSRDSSTPTNAVLGIRAGILEQDLALTDVFSWKEQRAFGVEMPPYTRNPQAALVHGQIDGPYTALHYIVIHEMGHILDFSNQANNFECKAGEVCSHNPETLEDMRKIVPVAGSWSALSWANVIEPVPSDDFPLRKDLCFYECNGRGLTLEKMPDFYHQLNGTQFVTTYAAVNAWEDFAESTAFHFLTHEQTFWFRVTDPVATYFLDRKWFSMQDKRAWIEKFYSQDLKYPEVK